MSLERLLEGTYCTKPKYKPQTIEVVKDELKVDPTLNSVTKLGAEWRGLAHNVCCFAETRREIA